MAGNDNPDTPMPSDTISITLSRQQAQDLLVALSNALGSGGSKKDEGGGKAGTTSFDWAIRIVPISGGGAAFQPRVPNTNPGDPLKAQVGDIVTWGNATDAIHQPWPTQGNTPDGAPLPDNPPGAPVVFSEPIPPGGSSTPQYKVVQPPSGTVIYYCCKFHPTERGRIELF